MLIKNILPIEEIRERDIDLLLLEEIIVNESFRKFIVNKLNLSEIGSFIGAYHSLTQERGESDLVINYTGQDKSGFLILIENKIDAGFTKRQAERYKERGQIYKREKDCSDFVTVLFAPQSYISLNHGFDYSISYETVKDWLELQKDKRSLYKAMMLDCAIERKRRGYQRIRNDDVTLFSHKFYELSESMYPELCFRKPPEVVPKGAGFRYCDPAELKENKIEIVHKFFANKPFNAVDLQIKGEAKNIEDFILKYKDKLEEGMEIVKVNNSLAVRFTLKRLETTVSFEEQKDDLILSIQYAKKLYDWALRHIIQN